VVAALYMNLISPSVRTIMVEGCPGSEVEPGVDWSVRFYAPFGSGSENLRHFAM